MKGYRIKLLYQKSGYCFISGKGKGKKSILLVS